MLEIIASIASIAGFAQQNSQMIGKALKIFSKQSEDEKDMVIKDDIAIVLNISNNCIPLVEKFLGEKGIDATVFEVNKKDGKREIDPYNRKEWEDIVTDFSKLLTSIYEQSAPSRVHIFLSAPVALAFGIGCVIRTLYRPYIYNYNRDTQSYDLVLVASDRLKG